MSTSRATVSLPMLGESLATTFPGCHDAPLARALLQQLAHGRSVSVETLAEVVGREPAAVARVLERWPNVQRDSSDLVVAFGGLSLTPTRHSFDAGGRRLYTWCAWDTLFLPELLGQEARVASRCPVTGRDVRLVVGPDGVRSSRPARLLVSFPPPAETSTAAIVESFCCHVHFLAGQRAAEQWLADHNGGLTLSLDDAFDVGRRATRALKDGAC